MASVASAAEDRIGRKPAILCILRGPWRGMKKRPLIFFVVLFICFTAFLNLNLVYAA